MRADSPNDTILQIQSGRCSANDVAYLKLNAVSYSPPFVQWKIFVVSVEILRPDHSPWTPLRINIEVGWDDVQPPKLKSYPLVN